MNIYRENIIEHYKNPSNEGNLDSYDIHARENNPLCGDEVEIKIKLNNNKIKEVKFQGKGCAISLASTDILLENIKDKSIEEIKNLSNQDVIDLLGIQISGIRLKCVILPLIALKNGVKEYERPNS
ncbi:MAG: Fe-S cluster assembly sulfur transfer protein SufU [Nanoarchaeota archaeon]